MTSSVHHEDRDADVAALVDRALHQNRMPELVRDLAGRGRLGELATLLAQPRHALRDWLGKPKMAYAIAPLMVTVSPDLRADAGKFIRHWIAALGVTHSDAMNRHIAASSDASVVAGLLALGAEPLAPLGEGRPARCALYWAIHHRRFDVVCVMLDHCLLQEPFGLLDERDSVFAELASFFGADRKPREFALRVLTYLDTVTLSASARASLGRALLGTNMLGFAPYDDRSTVSAPEVSNDTRRLLTMMTLADLSRQQWHDLLSQFRTDVQLPSVLAQPAHDQVDLSAAVIGRMAAAGVDLDALPARSPQHTSNLTMLQAAILIDNAQIVIALLDAGADPRLPVPERQCDGFALAADKPRVESVLAAWRARQAMKAAVAAPAAGRPA